MKLLPWLTLFRLPNLPTAVGDALAGAGIVLLLHEGHPGIGPLLGAAFAELFLYMAGLADNDLVGQKEDARTAPHRPIPAGELTAQQVSAAREWCFIVAIVAGYLGGVPDAWWGVFACTTVLLLLYNRLKDRFPRFGLVSMGLCRGSAVLLGVAAVAPFSAWATLWPVWVLAAGWTVYISMVTWLAAQEHRAETPLGFSRYGAGIAAVALPGVACLGLPGPVRWLPAIFIAYTLFRWCRCVAPLGRPHTPEIRRAAVGGIIGVLLFLQDGFLLLLTLRYPVFWATPFLCHGLVWLIRRTWPSVSGS